MDIHEIIAAVVDESNHDWIHLIHHGGDGRLSHYDTFVKECSGSLAPAWLSVSSPSWTNIGNFDYADLRRVSTDLGLTPFASVLAKGATWHETSDDMPITHEFPFAATIQGSKPQRRIELSLDQMLRVDDDDARVIVDGTKFRPDSAKLVLQASIDSSMDQMFCMASQLRMNVVQVCNDGRTVLLMRYRFKLSPAICVSPKDYSVTTYVLQDDRAFQTSPPICSHFCPCGLSYHYAAIYHLHCVECNRLIHHHCSSDFATVSFEQMIERFRQDPISFARPWKCDKCRAPRAPLALPSSSADDSAPIERSRKSSSCAHDERETTTTKKKKKLHFTVGEQKCMASASLELVVQHILLVSNDPYQVLTIAYMTDQFSAPQRTISECSSRTEVRAAYKALSALVHPDVAMGCPRAEDAYRIVVDANAIACSRLS